MICIGCILLHTIARQQDLWLRYAQDFAHFCDSFLDSEQLRTGGPFPALYLCIVNALYMERDPRTLFPQRFLGAEFGPFWTIFGAKKQSGPLLKNCRSELLTGSRGLILVAMEPCA